MFGEYNHLLVPVDGSEQSEISFKKAVAIAQRNHAKLHLIFVADTRNINVSPDYTPLSPPAQMDHIDYTFMDEFSEYGKKAGVDLESTVTQGNPMTLIADAFPKEFDIDLIVIGATGKGAVTRALVGSVSNYVVKNAKCDVLVVRT